MKLFDDQYHTHMPFAFEGKLLHCKALNRSLREDTGRSTGGMIYQAYDIHCSDLDGSNSFYIGANLGERVIACSPNAFRDENGMIVLNYVAESVTPDGKGYAHYQRIGESLQSLGPRIPIASIVGLPSECCMEDEEFMYSTVKNGAKSFFVQFNKQQRSIRRFAFLNVTHLTRLAVFREHAVILTFIDTNEVTKSAVFDLRSFELQEIKVQGKDIYKSHLYDGCVYHAIRAPGDCYGMCIHRDEYELTASDVICREF